VPDESTETLLLACLEQDLALADFDRFVGRRTLGPVMLGFAVEFRIRGHAHGRMGLMELGTGPSRDERGCIQNP